MDDLRACPAGWTPARTITEAIRLLSSQHVETVSLDHDIGCRLANGQEHSSNETFEPVARYIAAMSPKPEVIIHTTNVQAGRILAAILGLKYDYQIYNPI